MIDANFSNLSRNYKVIHLNLMLFLTRDDEGFVVAQTERVTREVSALEMKVCHI